MVHFLHADSSAAPAPFPADFSYAFQPIVDTGARTIVSYEALVRGVQGEPAAHVFDRVHADQLYQFDAASRIRAIALASELSIPCDLNLNFMPRSLLRSLSSIDSTLEAAADAGLGVNRLVIEFSEGEAIEDHRKFASVVDGYRARGLKVAIDDFGAAHSGLNLLAEFQPDQIKVDMALVRGIERHAPKQAIVRALVGACGELGIELVAEGVETIDELHWLEGQGVRLFQGFLFAMPGFRCLPAASFPPA